MFYHTKTPMNSSEGIFGCLRNYFQTITNEVKKNVFLRLKF